MTQGTIPSPEQISLETVANILHRRYSFGCKLNSFSEHMKQNLKPEALCILACEVGEKIAEFGFFEAGIEYWNTLALPAGFATGFLYALYHVVKHAKHSSSKATLTGALQYAASMELGCVVAATSTEWAAGAVTNTSSPYDQIYPSLAALPIAFGAGLAVLSGFTYFHSRELSRGVTEKGAAADIVQGLGEELRHYDLNYYLNSEGTTIKIIGKEAHLQLKEKALPEYLREKYMQDHSLLLVRSSIACYDHDRADLLRKFIKGMVPNYREVKNIYAHSHRQ